MVRAIALAVLVGALAWGPSIRAAPSVAKLGAVPETPDQSLKVAEAFAGCAGRWSFAAILAWRNSQLDTKQSFEEQARGWRIAGMFFLADGIAPEKASTVGEAFGRLEAAQQRAAQARYEVDPDSGKAAAELREACDVWAPLQQAVLNRMGRSTSPPTQAGR